MNLPFVHALLLLSKDGAPVPAPVLGEFKHEEYKEPVPIPTFDLDLSGYDFEPRGPPNRKQRRAAAKKRSRPCSSPTKTS